MDIRTKLVFTLVAVALVSMVVLGLTMYTSAEEALRESRLERLDGLAESKKDGLDEVFAGWIDRVSLVASRTQLRLSLQEHNRRGTPQTSDNIHRILSDAVDAVEVIKALAVLDLEQKLVASAGQEAALVGLDPSAGGTPVSSDIFYQGLAPGENGDIRVGFVATLKLDGELLGTLHVKLDAEPLLYLAEDRSGMGESGETIIVTLDNQGALRALHRARPGSPVAWEPIASGGLRDLAEKAMADGDSVYWQGVSDNRGASVWAAVRNLPKAEMALVVKVDEDEGRAPLTEFRLRSIQLGFTLGAFAVLFGTILGFRFSKPIMELAGVADRIREGALSARAEEEGEDEIALLARTFNDMAEEMEEQVTLLREFQRYFDLSLDMLCIASPDGFFKRVNPAFTRTLGWTKEELLSRPFVAFVHPEDVKKTEDEIEHLARGLPTISFENRYEVRGGGYRHLMWTAHPDRDSSLIYAIARDVTELDVAREEAKSEIDSLRSRLEAAEARANEDP
jgi:PAS domain S-box-containing protein